MVSYQMILYPFIAANIITFCVFGYDKYLAKNNKWRFPEKTLFLLTFMGGSVGAVIGMLLFRHKIAKPSFYLSVLLIIAIQIAVYYYFGPEGLIEFLK
jgi:uncharacterized membrane protein YsdA (DUF1294 family)